MFLMWLITNCNGDGSSMTARNLKNIFKFIDPPRKENLCVIEVTTNGFAKKFSDFQTSYWNFVNSIRNL